VEWIEMIWEGKLSELGRLQFEDHGGGLLDVHIPETGLPLDPLACDASFRRAREVYPNHHTAQCTSWLLDPQLADALPPASNIDLKQKAATQAGMDARDLKLPADTSEEDLLATIAELNSDDAVDGLLVQLPLPEHIEETRVIEAIAPAKDVDGIHPVNAGRLY